MSTLTIRTSIIAMAISPISLSPTNRLGKPFF
jgi:hypothetical protein